MAEPFVDLVAKTSADNRDLESGMRQSEQIVKASADKMTSSLAGISGASTLVGEDSETLTKSLVAMGAAGSLAGSRLGGMASGAAALSGAMTALGVSMGPFTLALAAIGAIGFGVFAAMANDAEGAAGTIDTLAEKLKKQREELSVLRGTLREGTAIARAARREAAGLFPDDLGEQGRFVRGTLQAVANQRLITAEKKFQADLTKGILAFEQAIADTAGRDIANAAADTAKAKAEELKLEQQLLAATKQRQAVMDTMAAAQEARNRSLARSLAVSVGLAKPSDFATNATEKRLLEIQEMLGGNAAATGGTAAPGGGFSIGGRPASEFRFGQPGGGAEFIGEQKEQAKQTAKLTSIDGRLEALVDFFTFNPTILASGTPQGLSFGVNDP